MILLCWCVMPLVLFASLYRKRHVTSQSEWAQPHLHGLELAWELYRPGLWLWPLLEFFRICFLAVFSSPNLPLSARWNWTSVLSVLSLAFYSSYHPYPLRVDNWMAIASFLVLYVVSTILSTSDPLTFDLQVLLTLVEVLFLIMLAVHCVIRVLLVGRLRCASSRHEDDAEEEEQARTQEEDEDENKDDFYDRTTAKQGSSGHSSGSGGGPCGKCWRSITRDVFRRQADLAEQRMYMSLPAVYGSNAATSRDSRTHPLNQSSSNAPKEEDEEEEQKQEEAVELAAV